MRITSDGKIGIGATPSGSVSRVHIRTDGNTASTYGFYVENSTPGIMFAVEDAGRTYTGTLANSPYNNTTGSAANLVVDASGILYRSTSSFKYKTDIKNAPWGLSEVMALRSVTYKTKTEDDKGKQFGGLIAEEVHDAGLTDFVQYADDGTPDSLAYGNMVSLCIKAIQDQQGMIAELQAKVAALEAS